LDLSIACDAVAIGPDVDEVVASLLKMSPGLIEALGFDLSSEKRSPKDLHNHCSTLPGLRVD